MPMTRLLVGQVAASKGRYEDSCFVPESRCHRFWVQRVGTRPSIPASRRGLGSEPRSRVVSGLFGPPHCGV